MSQPTFSTKNRAFLIESHENLDRLDRELIALERNPTAVEGLARMFRAIHDIKGTCNFLGFPQLETMAHAGEGLLSDLRDGKLTFNAEITCALRCMVDALRCMVDALREVLSEVERMSTARRSRQRDHGAPTRRTTNKLMM